MDHEQNMRNHRCEDAVHFQSWLPVRAGTAPGSPAYTRGAHGQGLILTLTCYLDNRDNSHYQAAGYTNLLSTRQFLRRPLKHLRVHTAKRARLLLTVALLLVVRTLVQM